MLDDNLIILGVFVATPIAFVFFVFLTIGIEYTIVFTSVGGYLNSGIPIVLVILTSLSPSSFVSIFLLFFQDIAYGLFGRSVLWEGIKMSYPTDAFLIQ